MAESESAPWYLPVRDEVEIFTAAHARRLPVLLKGPTGCGKTRFVEYMAHGLLGQRREREGGREAGSRGAGRDAGSRGTAPEAHLPPLVTVACHEDLTGSDLVGRYLIQGDETVWIDGPLTQAVRRGAICYLDEVVEARKDTIVLIHPLTDHRRILPIDRRGEILEAHPDFLLVISYNPGYQSVLKDLKHSTRQRFVSLEFDYPPRDREAEIVRHEGGVDLDTALTLATLGEKVRALRGSGLGEGVSTRLLVYAAQLVAQGLAPRRACTVAVTNSLTDDPEMLRSVGELVSALFPPD